MYICMHWLTDQLDDFSRLRLRSTYKFSIAFTSGHLRGQFEIRAI